MEQTNEPPPKKSRPKMSLPKVALIAIFTTGVFAVLIVAATYAAGGAGLAARSATDLAMPIGLLWLTAFASIIASMLRRHSLLAGLFLFTFLAIGVLFNVHLAKTFLQAMEYQATEDPVGALDGPVDGVIVLGGYIGLNRFGVPELSCEGQRIVLAARMWHQGKTRAIICTGTGSPGQTHQATLGKQMLVDLQVPAGVVFEVGGENTIGEMNALDAFLNDPPSAWLDAIDRSEVGQRGDGARLGLITSAFHMPRAVRLANATGLDFIPLPCSFQGRSEGELTARDVIPTANAARGFALALKEFLARFVGR